MRLGRKADFTIFVNKAADLNTSAVVVTVIALSVVPSAVVVLVAQMDLLEPVKSIFALDFLIRFLLFLLVPILLVFTRHAQITIFIVFFITFSFTQG